MKPFSACTTPRRLMAPISRHFLQELQPEPPAWLTTRLMKGSRLPFAENLVSGVVGCSGSGFSPVPALAALADRLFLSSSDLVTAVLTTTTAGAERWAIGRGPCFVPPGFDPCGLLAAAGEFTGGAEMRIGEFVEIGR